jgi:hypothetical protein
VLVLSLLWAGGSARAQAVDAEQGFVTRIDQQRQAAGLPTYARAADLQSVARHHAQRMADRGEHYHNPDLASEVSNWSIVAENVGRGASVEQLHQAFMGSPTHRANIMSNELTQVGVGVVQTGDGTLYVVQVFRRPMASAAAPAATPPPPPAPPAPATTTAPPSPTTVPPPAPTTTVPAPTTTAAAPTTTDPPLDLVRAEGEATMAVAVVSPTLPAAAQHIPAAAWVAAFLLAGVVGLQTVSLQRLGLLSPAA